MSELVMCVFDAEGNLVSSNEAHARMLRRERGQLTGHNFREWTPQLQINTTERNFFRGLEGEHSLFTRQVVRNDGTLVTGRSQLFTTELAGKRLVMGTLQVLDDPIAAIPKNKDVAAYISQMAEELAQMAKACGLDCLGDDLNGCAANAGAILEMLGKQQKDQ